jgi:endogenous inhibitor of DNA gyrase (YacG/DUF329 family)
MGTKVEDLAQHRESRREEKGHAMERPVKGRRRRRGCPVCGAPQIDRFRPFCSLRCADVDLGRWLGGGYRVPTDEPAEASEPQKSEPD